MVVRGMTDAINDRDLDALDVWVARDLRRHSGATPGLVVEQENPATHVFPRFSA